MVKHPVIKLKICILEIYERKAINKTRNKCKLTFDYVGKALLVLSATVGDVSIS